MRKLLVAALFVITTAGAYGQPITFPEWGASADDVIRWESARSESMVTSMRPTGADSGAIRIEYRTRVFSTAAVQVYVIDPRFGLSRVMVALGHPNAHAWFLEYLLNRLGPPDRVEENTLTWIRALVDGKESLVWLHAETPQSRAYVSFAPFFVSPWQ